MAKAIEFEIKIKGNSRVLKTLVVEASNADEAISRIVESTSRAGDASRRMVKGNLKSRLLLQRLGAPRKVCGQADWSEVITNWNIEKPLEFFARFQQYIPMAKL